MNSGIGRIRRQSATAGRRRRTTIVTVLAILVCAIALVGWRQGFSRGSVDRALAWRPDSATPRLVWARLDGPTPLGVGAFVRAGGRLYLADRLASQILELSPTPRGGWRVDSVIAQRPAIQTPLALAVDPENHLLVYDADHRIHVLDPLHGTPARTVTANIPCDPGEPQLSVSGHGQLVLAGRCPVGRGDTVSAVLLVSSDSGRTFTAAGTLPLYTRDGAWGSVLSAKQYARVYGDSVEFGTGVDGCVVRLALGAPEGAVRVCSPIGRLYDAPEPAAFAAVRSLRVSMAMAHGKATSWPHPLPAFLARVATSAGVELVRLVTGDSVQVELQALGGTRALLVAPLDGFRGCVNGDCLWLQDQRGIPRIRLEQLADSLVDARMREDR